MSTTLTLYGIPNCDSIKKTIDYLNRKKIPFDFHNYKKEGIDKNKLEEWSKQVGWEALLNTRGTTWKKIAPDYEGKKITEKLAISIMLEHNSIIKRPVLERGENILVGFKEETLDAFFKK